MLELDVEARRGRSNPSREEQPFRVLVIGDFGAAASAPAPVTVDRDNLDRVLAKLNVTLTLPVAGEITFRSVEDFHPDRLYARLPMFQALRDARRKLEDPETFQLAASEIAPPAKPDIPEMLRSRSLLEQIAEGASGDPFQSYLQKLVAPYASPRPDPKQKELLAQVDAAVNGQMRALLHVPAFQALEAAWRGVDALVKNVDSGVAVKVAILHLPFASLERELIEARDLKQTRLYEVLVRATSVPGAQRWTAALANYRFEPSASHVETLARIALLASAGDVPVIAGAAPDAKGWAAGPAHELRQVPESVYLGLAVPRFLLRMPYGPNADSTDTFDFDEAPLGHEDYLWGNGAFACGRLLIESFEDEGWAFQPSESELWVRDLPLHMYKEDGETKTKPCAETLMTVEQVEAWMELGLMPLVSYKDQALVRLAGFRAITGQQLAKRW